MHTTPHSDETKKKISNAKQGKPSNRRGVSLSKETRLKISRAKKGVSVHTPQQRAKWSVDRRGELNPAYINGQSKNLRFYAKQRQKREREAIGFHSEGEWETLKAQYGHTCPSCKRPEPVIKLTRDHVIPLVRGGTHFIENIQPLCQSCNSRKNTKTIIYNSLYGS